MSKTRHNAIFVPIELKLNSRVLKHLLGFSLSAVFLTLIARQIDWHELKRILFAVEPSWILLALLALFCSFSLRIVRWYFLVRHLSDTVTPRRTIAPYCLSAAANNVLPFRAGDVFRIYLFRDRFGISVFPLLGALFLEHLLDLFGLLLFFYLGFVVLPSSDTLAVYLTGIQWLSLAVFVLLVLLILLPSKIHALVDYILGILPGRESSPMKAVRSWNTKLFDALGFLQNWRRASGFLLFTLLIWGVDGFVYLNVINALSIDVSAVAGWFSMALGSLATALPSTPGHLGTFDFFSALAIRAFGVSFDHAAAFAFLVHVVIWIPVTLAGVISLFEPSSRKLTRESYQHTHDDKLDDKG